MIAFYREKLGFKLSDWIGDQMCFMRCTTDEHDLAVFHSADPQLNHIAFEYRGIDEFMRATGRVMKTGSVMRWGPGRHVVGDNTFAYFFDPNGNVSEITTNMEQCYDDWQPRRMKQEEAGDQWGTSPLRGARQGSLQRVGQRDRLLGSATGLIRINSEDTRRGLRRGPVLLIRHGRAGPWQPGPAGRAYQEAFASSSMK